MSAVPNSIPPSIEGGRQAFQRQLQSIVGKIQQSNSFDDIILDVCNDIGALFGAERITIYVVGEDKTSIISKIKTGLHSFKDLKLPVGEHSIAGYTGHCKHVLNIRDVYDDAELKRINPRLRFLQEVDRRTGYRSKQMLCAPILDSSNQELVGVVQLINTKNGTPFPPSGEDLIVDVCKILAFALKTKTASRTVTTKYDYLVNERLISANDLQVAQQRARKKSIDLETVLTEQFNIKSAQIGASLSKFFGVAYGSYRADRAKPVDLLKNLRRDYVESNQWIPLEEDREGVHVLTLDPERLKASRVVHSVLQKSRVVYHVTTAREFKATVEAFFGGSMGEFGDLLTETEEGKAATGVGTGAAADDIASAAEDNDLVKLVNKVIVDAFNQGASDIHIESYPGNGKTEVRFRKDGSLVPYVEVPATFRNAIVARLKIMCDLDISERRKPQDGKIRFKRFGPLDIELRVATLPTAGGVEDVVMRILQAGEPIPLDGLALSKHNYDTLLETIAKPYGIFFVCGPTGSGKTTTLHSILKHLNTPETKIWTAEDPVEITQKGLRQVQVNRKAGLDFATMMRAFLRADPDVIMVGEMRDKETTAIGIEASLTGHLVLSTLHTNSAPESVVRLLDMGMDPFNFADALLGILAQRLAKRLCAKCKRPYEPTAEELRALLHEYCKDLNNTTTFKKNEQAAQEAVLKHWAASFRKNGQFQLYQRIGCDHCSNTGYKGRVGLHELLVGSDTVKRLIQERARVVDVLAAGLEEGMRTLKMDGIEKVLQGVTDLAQVRAVCIK